MKSVFLLFTLIVGARAQFAYRDPVTCSVTTCGDVDTAFLTTLGIDTNDPYWYNSTADVDCVYTETDGACNATCGGGHFERTVSITTPAVGNGAACPANSFHACNTQSCTSGCTDNNFDNAGSYDNTDNSQCTCGYGRGSDGTQCYDCVAPKYNDNNASAHDADCADRVCPVGQGTTQGTFFGVSITVCGDCTGNTYSDSSSTGQCQTCSALSCASGQYTSGCGGSSAGACTACPPCAAGTTRTGCSGLSEGSCQLDSPENIVFVTVTNNGLANQLTIPNSYLIRGQVYRFHAPSGFEHPIYVRYADGTSLAVHSPPGQSYSATSGATDPDYVQFVPEENIELFCTNHASMVTPIPVYDEAPQQKTIGGIELSLVKQTELRNRASQKRENIRRKTAFASLTTEITNAFDAIVSRAKKTDMASYRNNVAEQRVSLASLDLTTKTRRESSDMKRSLIAQMKASKTEARIPVRFTKSELNIKPELETKLAARGVNDIVAYPARTDTTPPTQCNGEYVEIGDIQPGEYHESVQDDVGQIALNCWDGNMLAYTELTSVGDENTDDQYDVYCYENGIWLQQTGPFVEGDSYTCDGASEERYRTYEHIIGSNGGGSPGDGCTDPEASNYNASATVDDGSCEYDDNTRAPGETCAETVDCTGGEACTAGVCECIEAGQRVKMHDGTHKHVEALVPGDILLTPHGTTTVRSTRRGQRHLSAVHDVTCGSMTGAITGNHAYHCEGEWRLPQDTHASRELQGTTEVVAIETTDYCQDRILLESGLEVETWDGRGINEYRSHTYENGRRLRCTLKGSWREHVLQRVDSTD